tara:strand:+ start:430 stop:816 length:387 start_codon:yes stop_codon:yes gene_type:complete
MNNTNNEGNMQYTVEQIKDIIVEAKSAAKQASLDWVADWTAKTGGNEYGEPMYCGFASTNIYGIKGNTKAGRAMKAAGLSKNYEGAYSIWNPSEWNGQSMDVKEAGAQACADVFRKYGFTAYMSSRAD